MPVAVLCAIALIRGCLLAGAVPPFQAPDEPAHFDYTQRLAEHGRMPELRVVTCDGYSAEARALFRPVRDIAFQPSRPFPPLESVAVPSGPGARSTTGCGPDALYPPAYFVTAALGYRAAYDAPLLGRVHAARLASVAWGILGTVLAYLLGWWWSGSRADAVLVGLCYLLQPMIALLSAVVTPDAALFACAVAAFAAIAWALRRPGGFAPLAMLGTAAVVGVLVKPTFNLILPALAAGLVAALGPRRLASWARAAVTLAPAAAAAMWWSIHDRPALHDMVAHAPRPLMPVRAFLSDYVLDGERLFAIWVRSYWMNWGWLDTLLPEGWYAALSAVLLLGIAGALVGWSGFSRRERWLLVGTAGATGYVLAALYVLEYRVLSWQGMPFVQGRYLLVLWPLHVLALVTALRGLSRRAQAGFDGAWLAPSVLAVVNAAAIARLLTRYYS